MKDLKDQLIEKQSWIIFKLDRSEINKYNIQIEKILNKIYESGRKSGIKEQKKLTTFLMKQAKLL